MRRPAPGYDDAIHALEKGDTVHGVELLGSLLRDGQVPRSLLPSAHKNLGIALTMLDRRKEAIASLKASLSTGPSGITDAETYYNIGVLLAESGAKNEAEMEYRTAARLFPGWKGIQNVYNNLGNILADDRPEEAAAAYRAAIVASPAHAHAYNNLANVVKGVDDEADELASKRAAGRLYAMAVRLSPRYVEAYKNLGNLLKEEPAWRRSAVRAYRVALSLQPSDRAALMNLGDVLQWLGEHAAANVTFALAVERGVWSHPMQRPFSYVPNLRATPWWSLTDVPGLTDLFAKHGVIDTLMDDGKRLLAQHGSGFRPYLSPALASGNWTDVTLALQGFRQPGAVIAPRSYALYEKDFGEAATTMVLGSAYFSVLSPGARLRPHCGPTNARLRVHVGIDVPKGAAMRVGHETRPWREGEAFVFDDSFEHEVWNDGTSPRLVFIFDVWHPQLRTDDERLAAISAVEPNAANHYIHLRTGSGALPAKADLVADRRLRTIY